MGLIMLIFGLLAVCGGKIVVTRRITVQGRPARIFGAILLAPIPINLLVGALFFPVVAEDSVIHLQVFGIAVTWGCLLGAIAWAAQAVKRERGSRPAGRDDRAHPCQSGPRKGQMELDFFGEPAAECTPGPPPSDSPATRWPFGATIACGLSICALGVAALLWAAGNGPAEALAAKSAQEHFLEENHRALDAAIAQDAQGVIPYNQYRTNMLEKVNDAASDPKLADTQFGRVMSLVQKVVAELERETEAHRHAFQDSESWWDPSMIRNVDDLHSRMRRISRGADMMIDYRRIIDECPAKVRTLVAQSDLSPAEQNDLMLGFEAGFQADLRKEMADCQELLCYSLLDLNRVLLDRWGNWEMDPRTQLVLFDDDKDAENYNEWIDVIQIGQQRFARLQRQYLERLQNITK